MVTYCTNVHPGDTWAQIRANVRYFIPQVKRTVSPDAPFLIGLRLSAQAAAEISPRAAAVFLDWCVQEQCFVASINGFPFGPFHDRLVKEQAYLPDWRDTKRADYTRQLIALLRLWLPEGLAGSISTVPVGYRDHIRAEELDGIRENIVGVLEDLAQSAWQGTRIVLALEPEPGCVLERAADVIAFVDMLRLPDRLRPFLGVCFNCSHAAVAFENPGQAFASLAEAGIPVAKIHVSSAVRLTASHRQGVWLFSEPRYLHQTSIRSGGDVVSYRDLPDILPREPQGDEEWRIHYHLPIFDDGSADYGTTNSFTREVLRCRPPGALLEIETYTYDILPAAIRPQNVVRGICREFDWVRACL